MSQGFPDSQTGTWWYRESFELNISYVTKKKQLQHEQNVRGGGSGEFPGDETKERIHREAQRQ